MSEKHDRSSADETASGQSGRRATSYDVAKRAGVSQSAVSRVFSKNGSASGKMREKILKAAEELNYRPNAIARSLSWGRTRLVGMVITQYSQDNYPTALRAIVDVLRQTGDNILLQLVESDQTADDAVARLLEYNVDMVITAATLTAEAAGVCQRLGVPIVLVNRPLDHPWVDHVASDNFEATYALAGLLKAQGARDTVFLAGPEGQWVIEQRRDGFLAGCKAAGLPRPRLVDGGFDYEGGFASVAAAVDAAAPPHAIVAANDLMAAGARDAAEEMKLRVPTDVMVIGHDDTLLASVRAYSLTSTRQPMNAMLETAVSIAFERLEKPGMPARNVVMRSELIVRDSAPLTPTRTG